MPTPKKTPKPAAKKTPKPAAKKTSKPATKKAGEPAAKAKTAAKTKPGDLALAFGRTALGAGTPGVVTKDFPDRALLSVGTTKYALLIRDRDMVQVSLLLPQGTDAKKHGMEADVSRPGWARIRLGHAPEAWRASGVAELAAQTIAALGNEKATPAPARAPRPPDPFRTVADALVAALEAARGDTAKEEAALRAALDGYVAIAPDGDPDRTGVTHYLAEDGSVERPPAIERVPGCTEEDTLRWREKLLDIAGC